MLIIPAIDIKNGKCVRLTQGDFAKQIVYSNDPVAMAKKWQSEGAKMLHVVDLDGAKNGKPVNITIIKKIAKAVEIPIQVGGGIRNEKIIKNLLTADVSKVVLGTIALENEILVKTLLKKYPAQILIALDTKNGKLVKRGWLKTSSKSYLNFALTLEKLGVQYFIYTNVVSDGTLTQPDYQEIEVLLKKIKAPIIVGGGVSSIADIKKLKLFGAEGVIIGKALYEGKINLKEAINAG